MNLLEINPYIRIAMHSELRPFFKINRRVILDYEVIYLEDGEFELSYNEKLYHCKKGDILLLCPGIPHSFTLTKSKLLQPHIHFDLQYDSYSEKVFISFRDYQDLNSQERKMIRKNVFPHLENTPFLKIDDREAFLNVFFDIISSKNIHSLTTKANMIRLLDMIIAENAADSFNQPAKNSEIAFLVKSYIDANYQQDIQLNDLERQFGYSKYYIEKLFKREYHTSVINYRNEIRMAAAIELLKEHTVSETSEILGFSSIYAFSRAFRSAYGSSPTKYYTI